MERESKWFPTHNLRSMSGGPRFARRLRKRNRLLFFIKTSYFTGIVEFRRRVRRPPNRESRLAGLRAVACSLLGRCIRGHVVHYNIHICPNVQVA
jgi:hypothetical protein